MAKLCPQCEKENPSSANHCMHCGNVLTPSQKMDELDKLHRELSEAKKTNELLKSALESQLKKENDSKGRKQEIKSVEQTPTPTPTPTPSPSPAPVRPARPVPTPPPPRPVRPAPQVHPVRPAPPQKKGGKKGIVIILILAILGFAVWWGMSEYSNGNDSVVKIPSVTPVVADSYYTFAEKTNLRSSKNSRVDNNIVTTLDYGSRVSLDTYDKNWMYITTQTGGHKGYIASYLLLSESDYNTINTIFGNKEARMCINMVRWRRALLDYVKNDNDDWRVYCRAIESTYNTVLFPKLYDSNASMTDFAVILKNNRTGERKTVAFGFNADESVAWTKEGPAPATGYIKSMRVINGDIRVDYTN